MRCHNLWVEIFRKQLPVSIREDLIFTIQLGFDGALNVLVRKRGSQTKYETTMPFPENASILNTLKLPDEFIAKLCVLV
jgi:hypothetical protein